MLCAVCNINGKYALEAYLKCVVRCECNINGKYALEAYLKCVVRCM